MLKYKSLIEIVIQSRPRQYKLRGIDLPEDRRRLTHRVTGDSVIDILCKLRDQPPAIHDLKLKFCSNLHEVLLKLGHKSNPSNNGIILKLPSLDNNITCKVMVYPKTVQIDIGCTFRPFVYDISGVVHLTFVLGRIYQCIFLIGGNSADIPQVSLWIITHYHFGKDGSEAYSGQAFHRTFDDVASGLVRFYSKKMNDGKVIPRIEQIHTPNISLDQEIERMIVQEETSP